MRAFRDIPIKRKLTLVIMLTSGAAIVLSSALIIGYQMVTARLAAVHDLRTVANIIAVNSSDELLLHESKSADRTLATLATRPEILAGRICDKDGNVFAHYARPGVDPAALILDLKGERHLFHGSHLLLSHRILAGGEPIGTVTLVVDRVEQQMRLRYSVIVVVILMAAALCVALLLASRVQEVVSGPIRNLAVVARAVATEKNYSLRATPGGQDETGMLVGAFNQMLDHIQKRDEDLRASEGRFRQLAETISQVFWMTNVEKTQMLYVSPAYEEIWGRTCDSLYRSPKNWLDAIHPEDRDRVSQALSKQASGGYDETYRVTRPSGAIRWIHDRAFPIHDKDGKVYRVVGCAEDITAGKQVEEALRLQGEIARNLEEGIVLTRASDTSIVYANPKFERMFGYEPGELNGRLIQTINAATEHAPVDAADEILGALNRDGVWSGEVHNRKKNGTEFWCFANVCGFDHPEYGKVWISVHTDITERKHAGELLREAETKFRQLVEQVPAITYTAEIGQAGRWHYISPQVESMLGFSPLEWLNNPGLWIQRVHPEDRGVALAAEVEVRRTGKFSGEYRLIARDGREIWVHDDGMVVPATESRPAVIQGVIQDITERKQLQNQLLEVSDREQRRIGQDLHDGLCQVLTGTTFAINALEQKLITGGLAEAANAREIAKLLHRANIEARNVARGLHPGELEVGGLPAALHELAFNVQSLFNVSCQFRCDTSVALGDSAKAVHVYRIAQEAVNNALKHSGANHIGITLTQSNGSVALTVNDDGSGFAPAAGDRGGMGLNIMTYRARMIGGSLQVRSGDERGTIVSLVYPAS